MTRKQMEAARKRRVRRMLWVVGVLLALITLLPLAAAFGEETTADPSESAFSGFVLLEARSKYVGTNGAVFHSERIGVAEFNASFGRGWYADIWASHSGGTWRTDFGHEVDLTVGRVGEITGFSYDAGVAYYAIVGEELGFEDVLNPYIKVSRPVGSVEPYLKFEHYFPIKGSAPASGQQYRLGVDAGGMVSHFGRVSISASAEVFYDTGAFGFERGWLGDVSVGLSYAVTDTLSLGPSVAYYVPISGADDRSSTSAVSFALTRSF